MAKIKKSANEFPFGTAYGDQVHFNVRIPKDWVPYLSAVLETKKEEHGTYRLSTLVREAIFQCFVKPNKQVI